EPREVFVLFNKNLPASREVAEHYRQKRGVPAENLIPLDVPDADEISRDDYQRRIVTPLRAALKDHRQQARVLLCVYGVPLRVGPQAASAADQAEMAKLKPMLDQAREENQKLLQALRVIKAEVEKD